MVQEPPNLPDGRWARFSEIGTNRPIFAGRDGVVRYSVDEIEKERQDGYGDWPVPHDRHSLEGRNELTP